MKWWRTSALTFSLIAVSFAGQGAKDPGPRPGPAGAGGFYPTLNPTEQAAFANGIVQFLEDEQVPDAPQGAEDLGLDSTVRVAAPAILSRQR